MIGAFMFSLHLRRIFQSFTSHLRLAWLPGEFLLTLLLQSINERTTYSGNRNCHWFDAGEMNRVGWRTCQHCKWADQNQPSYDSVGESQHIIWRHWKLFSWVIWIGQCNMNVSFIKFGLSVMRDGVKYRAQIAVINLPILCSWKVLKWR